MPAQQVQILEDRKGFESAGPLVGIATDEVRGVAVAQSDPAEISIQPGEEPRCDKITVKAWKFPPTTPAVLIAAVKRGDEEAFINVPELVVSRMLWTERQARDKQRGKLGPRARNVEKLYGSRSPSIQEPQTRSGS